MASSQGTTVPSNSHDIFLFKYHFLLHILCFLFFFSDNIMADVASKQQTTALFLSTTVTLTRRHTELTNLLGKLCCAREHSVQFFVQFFTHLNCTFWLKVYGTLTGLWGPLGCMGPSRRRSAVARFLGLWVRSPTETWMSVCFECCRVGVSATSWSLVQGSPADCGASLCVI
jgi:hypothetical protein